MLVPEKRRGLKAPIRGLSPSRQNRTEELLFLGLQTFAEAAELPLNDEVVIAFNAVYEPVAERLSADRVWRLVGDQLLAWLTHQGQEAAGLAIGAGRSTITRDDLYSSIRETRRISASAFCPAVP